MHTTVTCPPAEITLWQSRLDEEIPGRPGRDLSPRR